MYPSQPSVHCSRTCSVSNQNCDNCPDNPANKYVEYSDYVKVEHYDIPKMRKDPLERIRQKKSWKAIQDKHSRRR